MPANFHIIFQEIKQYLVQWIDDKPTRPVVNGVLKVFHPSVSHKWQNEMNAACKLLGVEHPNIARYHWGSPKNRFNSAICTFTADIVGQETRYTIYYSKPSMYISEIKYVI